MRCVICGGDAGTFGHNAAPIAEGQCCSDCNDLKVLPARLRAMRG